MENEQYIASLVEKAKIAQKALEGYTQEQADALVKAIAKVVFDNAEPLARMAADETRMGVYEDKIKKNQGKSRIIWNHLKGKKSVGILRVLEDEGLVEVAKPMGVIGAVTPCTNPIVTPMCNAMFAIKGLNSIIIAPHPRGKKCAKYMAELFNEQFRKLNAPENIFQVIEEPTIELTSMLMKAVDVVVATGGMGMVKSAYSSGKPSFGVGTGNVQCIIDRGMNFDEVAKKVIEGRTFDNGIICSGEQTLIVHEDDYKAVIEAFKANGAYYTEDEADIDKIRASIFPDGVINKDAVGQSVQAIAKLAGIAVPAGTRVIIAKPKAYGKGEYLSKEKMCPLMTSYTWKTWEEAVATAYANLMYEGAGHSVVIHSNDKQHVEYAGLKLPVSRILINQICSTMNGGSFMNSLNPTTTLGCGSWGNNSISENLNYTHLFNVSRIAYVKPGARVPTDDEIWG